MKRKGRGLLNSIIDKIPIEVHIPGYKFCGPGTKLAKRLGRGDKGVNKLDEACREHDIAYDLNKNISKRHEADKKLYNLAKQRITSVDAPIGEKIASTVVAGIMKSKTALGMGLRKRRRRHNKKKTTLKGGALSFKQALKIAKAVVNKNKNKNLFQIAKHSYNLLKKYKNRIKYPKTRVIPIPKQGGFLPLLPLFAVLGALGSVGGGAAAIAKAVNDAKAAKEELKENQRHNRAMEAKSIGSGFYIKPYKKGCGLYFTPSSKN